MPKESKPASLDFLQAASTAGSPKVSIMTLRLKGAVFTLCKQSVKFLLCNNFQ